MRAVYICLTRPRDKTGKAAPKLVNRENTVLTQSTYVNLKVWKKTGPPGPLLDSSNQPSRNVHSDIKTALQRVVCSYCSLRILY